MEKRKASITDMTCGSPLKLILAFAIPMLIGTLFQQFYSMVDTVMVGKYLGVNSLAAVGSTGAIFFMVNGFVIGNTAGFAIPVAQKFGAKDYKEMRKFTMNAVYMGIFFSVVLTAVVCLLTKTILIVTNTPAEIIYGTWSCGTCLCDCCITACIGNTLCNIYCKKVSYTEA